MATAKQKVEAFFAEYAARTNRGLKGNVDAQATVDAFTDCFIEASPKGVSCGENNDEFREQVPKGIEFCRSIGTQAMNIVRLDVTPLDDFHAMAKIHWEALYKKKDGSEDRLEFDVIYFVQILNDTPKVFAFIAGDEEQMYKDHGLVPN